ncbi:MAG: monooxygenase [Solirubrobacteraceae bacterium]|jgi:cation diffusion facilitator CzcD-associated flavoprotein CzcO|nr:monooxygenase [Solirubrobacteraceae bacterium]
MRTTVAEHVDVLIVGAGLSGIGAACHLERRSPGRSYVVLEARDAIGGTWDLFRYPGVRSDSDMHTLGYSFRPWEDAQVIADGPSILRYVRETADDYGVTDRIRFNHRVISADWSSDLGRWRVTAQRADTGQTVEFTASFVLMCSGYYRYDRGYVPEFPGREDFAGHVIHPQHWPEDLDYAGQRVVVIGSGATAVTLVPSLAETAAHVTMLQRSPSYVVSLPAQDRVASALRRRLPSMVAYQAVRAKNVALMTLSYQLSRRFPQAAKALIRRGIAQQLPVEFDIDTHFRPHYDPWDQRLCVCPDGDLFRALGSGRASVVTEEIDTFTARGIRLRGGRELEADIIVSATGLQLLALGGAQLTVDGAAVDLHDHLTYKGLMLDGVPNLALCIGYTNASWTLKCDLTCEYVCRLLNHMAAEGYTQAVPIVDRDRVSTQPLLNLDSGYIRRSLSEFPQQGSESPWRLRQNYPLDAVALRMGRLEDGVMRFGRGARSGSMSVSASATSALALAEKVP